MQYPQPYGNYVLLERLGVGGMSEVDLARKAIEDAEYIRFLVIKRIKADKTDDNTFVRMFKDEARITAELHHTNIAHVYDFGKQGDEYYMALEYVPGIDLRRCINVLRERQQRLPPRIALRVLADVLSGLDYAHKKVDSFGNSMKIVHRDVNPRNIMISARGEVKLIDFGVAKATNRLERTTTDHVKGKFAYMAPEQIAGRGVDHRADVFAAGLVLHELLTGYGPFYGMSQVQIMHRLLSGRLPDLPSEALEGLPDPQRIALAHSMALAPNAAHRYKSAAAFRRDLEKASQKMGGLATQSDLADFLRYVDPELEKRLERKAQTYAGSLTELIENVPPSEAETRPMEALGTEGSMSGVSRSVAVRSTGMVAGGMFLGMATTAVALVVVLALVAALLYSGGYLDGTFGDAAADPVAAPSEPEPAPEDAELDAADEADDADEGDVAGTGDDVAGTGDDAAPDAAGTGDDVAPDVEGEQAAAPDPAPVAPIRTAPSPVPAAPVAAEPAPAAPEPAPGTGDPAPAVAPAPAPSAQPAPAEPESGSADDEIRITRVTAPDPEPAVAPDPVPAVTGQLQVTSEPPGQAILIDGTPSGHVTPAKFEWAVGTVDVSVAGLPPQTATIREGLPTVVVLR